MNALVSLDSILEPSVPLSAGLLFGSGQIDAIVSQIEADVRSEVHTLETEEGRERIKSVAYKIARSKTTLDEIGKEHVAVIKAQSAAIDKERKALRDRLDALKDEVRGPLTAWEYNEAKRVADHEAALVFVLQAPNSAAALSSEHINALKAHLEKQAERNWQEFNDRALEAFREVMPKICALRDAAEQRERDAAELEALRKEKAERDDAEAKAKADREAAERERVRAEWLEHEKAKAVASAIEEERKRAEDEKAKAIECERRKQEQEARDAAAKKAAEEAAERKRQENKKHRAKINNDICADLIAAGVPNDSELVQGIVKAIVAGSIRHVSINY